MLELGRTAERLDLPERRVTFSDGASVDFDHLVYTLPLSFLPRFVDHLPPEVERAVGSLRCQGIYCVNLGIDRPDVSDKHWVYFYEDVFPFHRLSFPANFSPDTAPPGKSSIATEVAFSEERPLAEDEAVERTVHALRAAKILRPDDRIELVHTERIHPAYVIYDLDHAESVRTIRDWLKEHHVWTAGRFGEWQYFNMDHSMRSGKSAAEEILATRGVEVGS
jgi:UDP-galactopyranose mutase